MLTQLPQPLTQATHILPPLLCPPYTHGNGLDLFKQLLKVVGFGTEGRDTQARELITLGRCHTARPEQQQVRPEAEQALHVKLPLAPYRGQVAQRRWAFAAVEHAHQQVIGLQLKHDFAHRRRKADHAQRLASLDSAGQHRQQAEQAAHHPS
ncbi:hypothetical protein D3C81_1385130 [compost metagenome]